MKAVVAAFNQEKALVGAFSVITNLRMELFEALVVTLCAGEGGQAGGAGRYSEEPRVLQLLPPRQRRGGPDLADQEVAAADRRLLS